MKIKRKKLKVFIAECVKDLAENKYISNNNAFIGKVCAYLREFSLNNAKGIDIYGKFWNYVYPASQFLNSEV